LEIPDEGSISIGSDKIEFGKNTQKAPLNQTQWRRKIGMVFQSYNLFPHLNLLENLIKAPVVVLKKPKKEATEQAHGFLKKVGLTKHFNKYPSQLSGGEQQRGAIARALMMKPEIMLYDEPTSALDPERVDEVLEVMMDLKKEGLTQIIVSHEMRFVRDASDVIYFMENGTMVDFGPSSKMFTGNANPRIKQFLKRYI
jgi:ABC-type polar amino acid transport system ATPase subunit